MPNSLLTVSNLTIDFSSHRGDVRAVDNVSFELHRGETLAIVGESGSGKSVTSLALLGLIPMPPGRIASGQAIFQSSILGETDLLKLSETELRQVRGNDIGMIFQEPMTSLNPVYTCGSQVVEALRLHTDLNEAGAKARTIELFTEAQLPRPESIFGSYPHEISGGQKQRVSMARALVKEPKILILDDSLSAVDTKTENAILGSLQRIMAQRTSLIISHRVSSVKLADEILVLDDGVIVQHGTHDALMADADGLYRIIGRVDDVINVSGHRFGTAEIENAINQNEHVVESAVVGYPHDVKGQGIYAYVICQNGLPKTDSERTQWEASIIETVVAEIGKIAKPDKIQIVSGLPKTRSGKIMRRILRKVAEGETSNLGDVTTLLDPLVVEEIVAGKK